MHKKIINSKRKDSYLSIVVLYAQIGYNPKAKCIQKRILHSHTFNTELAN